MQRLCLHVQLVDGTMHVVAPDGMELCARGGSLKSRLSCSVQRRSWPSEMADECHHRSHSTTYVRSSYCNATARMQQPGVTVPDFWSDFLYPHTLEWHFSSSLNLTSCRATGEHVPLPGDHNHVFTRLRLQTAMRLLLRAYQRLHSRGQLQDPLELILCPNETPVNFGDWCVEGAQPIFSSTTNEHSPLIPFAQWIQDASRDVDLAWWNPKRKKRDGDTSSAVPGWNEREPKAVFRGSVHRLSVYSDDWRAQAPRRTQVTPKNWHQVGRTALLAAKARRPDLINMRLQWKSVEAEEGLPQRLRIPDSAWAGMDQPEYMRSEEQMRFKYGVNVEGHGGWADRGYKMLLQPQLAIIQDMPALPWYLRFFRPYQHYVPVDSNLRNITQAVEWARAHDSEAQRMVVAANTLARDLLHPSAIFRYVEELLLGYAPLLRYKTTRHERAVPFVCEEAVSDRTCKLHQSGSRPEVVRLGETHCHFRSQLQRSGSARQRFHTLYEASLSLPSESVRESNAVDAQGAHSPSVVRAMQGRDGHRSEL